MIYGLADREIRARQWLQDQATPFSQFAASHLTLKQQSAEIAFKLLDCPSQRWLRYVASLSRPCEVALTCDNKKIFDLMQFHWGTPNNVCRAIWRGQHWFTHLSICKTGMRPMG